MPWSLETLLGIIGRGQEPLSLSLAASPTLCKKAPYISDLSASRLLSLLDHAEADIRWAYHAVRDYNPEDGLKEQTVFSFHVVIVPKTSR